MKTIFKFLHRNYDISNFIRNIVMVIIFGLVMIIFAYIIFKLPITNSDSLKNNGDMVKAFVTGIFTICSAILTGFFTHENTNREIAMQYITGKRLDWLKRANVLTAQLCSDLCEYIFIYNNLVNNKNYYDKLNRSYSKMIFVLTDLYLHYNFTGGRDRKILSLIRLIENNVREFQENIEKRNDEFVHRKLKELEKAVDALVKHSQIYHKLEWERIKEEAHYTGNIKLRDKVIRKNMVKTRLRLYEKQVAFDNEDIEMDSLSLEQTYRELLSQRQS